MREQIADDHPLPLYHSWITRVNVGYEIHSMVLGMNGKIGAQDGDPERPTKLARQID
jgi:hypothetical protein